MDYYRNIEPFIRLERYYPSFRHIFCKYLLYSGYMFRCFIRNSLQAFSLPGSMYLSILAGAAWGMPFALPFCCTVSR